MTAEATRAAESEPVVRRLATRVVDLWYVVVPSHLGRWSPGLARVVEDGAWLARWPKVAASAPIVTAAAGLVSAIAISALPRSGIHVWSESLPVMIFAIASGMLSTTFGLTFVAGYAAADLVGTVAAAGRGLVRPAADGVAATFVEYALLALAAVLIPQLSKRAARDLPVGHDTIGMALRAVSYAALAAILVALWAQATVVLIRPAFTWLGGRIPAYQAIEVVQTQWAWLAGTAFVAGLARAVGEFLFCRRAVGTSYGRPLRRPGLLARLPAAVRRVIAAGIVAILWAGMYESNVDGIVVGAIVLAVSALGPLMERRLPAWSSLVRRVPLLLRMLIVVGGGLATAGVFANLLWGIGTFRTVLIATVAVFVLSSLILPEAGSARTPPLRAESARP